MLEAPHDLRDVFGISRDSPLTYVAREKVDAILKENLGRSRHLVIHGSSKQGKTCLRKECLDTKTYIAIQCSNKWTILDLNSAILKQAGFEITQSAKRTSSGKFKVDVKFLQVETSDGDERTTTPMELELEDVNDIIAALKQIKFSRSIILEDFHYLPIETQKDFAVALKAYHENSHHLFIIIGVWLEENRLAVYNGDLTGRLVSINADEWSSEELKQVIEAGEQLLNVEFDPKFVTELVAACSGSVYLLQEACYKVCRDAGVEKTLDTHLVVGRGIDPVELVRGIVNEQQGRYRSFLTQFANGFQESKLKMYQWLLYPVITASPEELQNGLKRAAIRSKICTKHPEGQSLNQGNLTMALQSVADLQVKKEIKPFILDYDDTNQTLNVVDRGFLIWIKYQDQNELLEYIDLGE